MKTVTVRDLRLHWPKIERQLAESGGEMIITRDAQPVARLSALEAKPKSRRQFDPAAHMAWLKKTWGTRATKPWVDEAIARDRADD